MRALSFKEIAVFALAVVLVVGWGCKKDTEDHAHPHDAPDAHETPEANGDHEDHSGQDHADHDDDKDADAGTTTGSGTADGDPQDMDKKQPSISSADGLVPIDIKLPKAIFIGTPSNMKIENLEPYLGDRPPFLAPADVKNLVAGMVPASTDDLPIIGELEYITDGDKEATEGSYVELGPGQQYITFDLGKSQELYAIVCWHYHSSARVYFDVIVQLADDQDFTQNVRTIFNNDIDNSAGLGVGKDMHYLDKNEGKLFDAKGNIAQFIRLYSAGNHENDLNHYIEVEVYGRDPK